MLKYIRRVLPRKSFTLFPPASSIFPMSSLVFPQVPPHSHLPPAHSVPSIFLTWLLLLLLSSPSLSSLLFLTPPLASPNFSCPASLSHLTQTQTGTQIWTRTQTHVSTKTLTVALKVNLQWVHWHHLAGDVLRGSLDQKVPLSIKRTKLVSCVSTEIFISDHHTHNLHNVL